MHDNSILGVGRGRVLIIPVWGGPGSPMIRSQSAPLPSLVVLLAMNHLSWNCRRFRNLWTIHELSIIVREKDPNTVFLMDTRSDEKRMEGLRCKLGFHNKLIISSLISHEIWLIYLCFRETLMGLLCMILWFTHKVLLILFHFIIWNLSFMWVILIPLSLKLSHLVCRYKGEEEKRMKSAQFN